MGVGSGEDVRRGPGCSGYMHSFNKFCSARGQTWKGKGGREKFSFWFFDERNSSMVYADGVMPHRGKRCLNRIAGVMSLST